jgi:16S rRNA (adenine1518-N6/adenine1519-N6)-dimethyltransferase
MMDRHETEMLLRQFGIRPTHSLGQNFLVDERVGQHILQLAGPERDDQVIEIGPGLGALTRELAATAGRIVAVEIDRHLIPLLEQVLMKCDNCRILNQDALKTDLAALAAEWPGPTLVAANLPYYITTPIIEKILCELPACRRLVFTVQKEAADRLLAGPGSKAYGPAAILLALHGAAKCSLTIPPAAFWPRPHIESTVLVINRETRVPGNNQLPSAPQDRRQFLRFLNQCFRQRRKKLANNLPALPDRPIREILEQSGLSPDIRAEQMAPDQFLVLWHLLV